MQIKEVKENKKQYMDLLFLADEQEDMIDRYLDDGQMFVLLDPDPKAECVVCDLGDGIFEIKNIATDPRAQGKGYGRKLIEFVMDYYKDRCQEMLVGTGDSPLTVPFYKKCGFTEHHRVKNFFTDNYDHPIIEAGVQLVDMVYLSRKMGEEKMNAIVNTKLILEDSIIFDGAITFENGVILQMGKASEVQIPEGAEIIDAGGKYTAPGLIDIHNHGGCDFLFYEDPKHCCEFFLAHGETTLLPTFYSSLTAEKMIEGYKKIKALEETPIGSMIGGLYMEGPYMGSFGSNQKYILWGGPIDKQEYAPLLQELAGYAKIWAIDPGRPGIEGFMADVKAADPNAIFTMGHSKATAAQCRKVKKYGLKLQTHHNDSGKAPGRAQGTMGAGCDEYALYDPDIYAELICDENGIHVDPELIKMVVRTKGVERIILITDHMADKDHFTNNEEEGILYGPDLNYDYEGHLAGSHLTLENACRNLMAHSGYGLCHAIRMATLNPARLLGIEDQVGSLEPGKKANLIIIDDMIHVDSVFLDGKLVAKNGKLC